MQQAVRVLQFFAAVFGTTVAEGRETIAPIYRQIEPFRDRRAADLSGGMKQKLALCCALVHRPRILLLDEPTTGVDAVSRQEFWDLLDTLRADGLTIVVSTPYMDEASMCDRIALIQNGRIMEINTLQNIVAEFPKELYAVKADNMYRLNSDLKKPGKCGTVYIFGEYLHLTPGKEGCGNIKEYLERNGHTGVGIERIEATIEDCFMELMSRHRNGNE